MNIAQEHRKLIWMGAVALSVIYFTPYVVTMAMQMADMRRAAQMSPTRPSPFPASAPTGIPAPPPPVPFHDLPGIYAGSGTLATRGMCGLKLEIRGDHEKPNAFEGYATLRCTPMDLLEGNRRKNLSPLTLIGGFKPTSAILSGVAGSDGIRFHVEHTIGAADGCAPTAFDARAFGTNQLAVEWQDSCRGGALVLNKSGR